MLTERKFRVLLFEVTWDGKNRASPVASWTGVSSLTFVFSPEKKWDLWHLARFLVWSDRSLVSGEVVKVAVPHEYRREQSPARGKQHQLFLALKSSCWLRGRIDLPPASPAGEADFSTFTHPAKFIVYRRSQASFRSGTHTLCVEDQLVVNTRNLAGQVVCYHCSALLLPLRSIHRPCSSKTFPGW